VGASHCALTMSQLRQSADAAARVSAAMQSLAGLEADSTEQPVSWWSDLGARLTAAVNDGSAAATVEAAMSFAAVAALLPGGPPLPSAHLVLCLSHVALSLSDAAEGEDGAEMLRAVLSGLRFEARCGASGRTLPPTLERTDDDSGAEACTPLAEACLFCDALALHVRPAADAACSSEPGLVRLLGPAVDGDAAPPPPPGAGTPESAAAAAATAASPMQPRARDAVYEPRQAYTLLLCPASCCATPCTAPPGYTAAPVTVHAVCQLNSAPPPSSAPALARGGCSSSRGARSTGAPSLPLGYACRPRRRGLGYAR
jgi:hypothetical protein